jgi:predicted phosphodiesterase
MDGHEPLEVPERFRDPIRWNAGQLQSEDGEWVASWPSTLSLTLPALGVVHFCHATPRSDTEMFTKQTPQDQLHPIFDPLNADIVVCGHTHVQFDRKVGRTRVLNAGSVGMPFEGTGAYWLILGSEVELRRTIYDVANAASRIRASRYPEADEFIASYVVGRAEA